MMRAIRALTLAGLLTLAIYMTLVFRIIAESLSPYNGSLLTALLVKDIVGQAGFALAFAAGVVAVVACLRQRQRWWAATLIVLLVLAPFGLYLTSYFLELHHVEYSIWWLGLLRNLAFAQNVVAIVLAVVVLIYSLRRRSPASSAAPGRADGGTLPS